MKKHHYASFFLFILQLQSNYCFSQGVWMQKASLPDTARYDAMSFSISNKGYIIGGFDGATSNLMSVWEYNGTDNSWTKKKNFITIRWMGIAFSINSKGYAGTGQNNNSYYNDFWEYDPLNDVWSQKASLPACGRSSAVGFAIGNKGYVGTGYCISNSLSHKDFWEYDPIGNSWGQKADFPGGRRSFAVGFTIGAKGYVGTGIDSTNSMLEDFWEYYPATDTWTQKSNFPNGKRRDIDGAHFTIGNYGYIGSGWQNIPNSTFYNDFWKYNPSNDIWTQIPNLTGSVRMGASGFSLNNKGYIGMGTILFTTCFNDLWEYNPIDSCSTPIAKFNYTPNAQTATFNNLTSELCPACSWFWNFGDGSTSVTENPVHIYDTAGSYLVTFTACDDTCCDSLAVIITLNAVGIKGTAGKNRAALYQNIPNPFSNETTIHYFLPERANDAEIVLYDNSGKAIEVILLKNKGNGSVTIDLSRQASGAYSYSLTVDGKLADTRRMMKNR